MGTLVAQKADFKTSKDSCLSTIKISFNRDNKKEFRKRTVLAGKVVGADIRIKMNQLTDLDTVNNSVLLKVGALGMFGRCVDRRIFFLEKDGRKFLEFLINGENGPKLTGFTMDNFKRTTLKKEETLVVGYTVTLSKDNLFNEHCFGSQQTSQLRVHMKEDLKTVKHFELAQAGLDNNLFFQIDEVTFNKDEQERVLLKINRTEEAQKKVEKSNRVMKEFNGAVENRWLYYNDSTDGKRFLLFLLEMFYFSIEDTEGYCPYEKCRKNSHKNLERTTCKRISPKELRCSSAWCNSKWCEMFSDEVFSTIKEDLFMTAKGKKFVQEHINPSSCYYGLARKDENEQNFIKEFKLSGTSTTTPQNDDVVDFRNDSSSSGYLIRDSRNRPNWLPMKRRRLAEGVYYVFIGFNVLLMCTLLVGISFACHVGTHEMNYEPIRW